MIYQQYYRKVAFSGYKPNEIPTKTSLKGIGLEVVESKEGYFDILILKDNRRTLKFLIGLI